MDETLPNEYEKCLVGITSILKEAWNTASQSTENKKEKIQALSLAKECYSMKLDLLTNATVVGDAIRFVSEYSSKKRNMSKEKDNKESKELEHNNEDSELEEEQETGEIITTETTMINQVF